MIIQIFLLLSRSVNVVEFILVILFINYCIIFYTNNCKPAFATPCIVTMFLSNLTIDITARFIDKCQYIVLTGKAFSKVLTNQGLYKCFLLQFFTDFLKLTLVIHSMITMYY